MRSQATSEAMRRLQSLMRFMSKSDHHRQSNMGPPVGNSLSGAVRCLNLRKPPKVKDITPEVAATPATLSKVQPTYTPHWF